MLYSIRFTVRAKKRIFKLIERKLQHIGNCRMIIVLDKEEVWIAKINFGYLTHKLSFQRSVK